MTETFHESGMWRKLHAELLNDPDAIDLEDFKVGGVNDRLAGWNIPANSMRWFKTLLFNAAQATDPRILGFLDRIANRDLGGPVQVTIEGRKVCMDYLQAIHELAFLEEVLVSAKRVVEIGAGYGRTCHSVVSAFKNIERYTIIDLPPCLRLSQRYLQRVLDPADFAKIAFVRNDELAAADLVNDLTINIDSMAEMDAEVVRSYLGVIARNSGHFYAKNPVGKFSPESVGVARPQSVEVNLALTVGPLTEVLDIFDTAARESHVDNFLAAYCPAPNWTTLKHGWAVPWSYYHNAVFVRG